MRCFTVSVKRALVLIVVLALAAIAAAVARGLQFRGVAKPGVHVLGVDVGGKSRAEIQESLRSWSAHAVTIHTDGHTYHVPRGWLVEIDARSTATRALAAGSAVSLVVPERVDVNPVARPAGGSADVLRALAKANRKPVSATVKVRGTAVETTPARDGLELDRAALLKRLAENSGSIVTPYRSIVPAIRDPAARSAASTARLLLARPVAIEYHGAHRGSLPPAQLARALRIHRRAHRFAVGFDPDALARAVRPRLGHWITRAHNAQFAVAAERVRIVPSRPGRDVDPLQLTAAVTAAAHGNHLARVELGDRQPDLTTAKAKELGITRKLVSYTTEMGASSSNRIHNVHLMADFIDGTVIQPGQTFSFNDVVGPRTAERGFLEGQEIIGSLVLPSIGGGVCQDGDHALQRRCSSSGSRSSLARTTISISRTIRSRSRTRRRGVDGPDFQFKNDLKHGLLDQDVVLGRDPDLHLLRHVGRAARRRAHRSADELDAALHELRSRSECGARLGEGRCGHRRTGLRRRRRPYGSMRRTARKLRSDVFESRTTSPTARPPCTARDGRRLGPYIVLPTSV